MWGTLVLWKLSMATTDHSILFICWVDDDVRQDCEQTVVSQRTVESLESCNCKTEAFLRSGPCCISITVHLLITPSNPKDWLSILGYSSHDLHVKVVVGECGARLIPVVKPMWGLISLHDLTSRAIGFKSISDDYIMFQAPLHLVRPKLTSACSGKNFDDRDQKAWPQTVLITHSKWKHDTVCLSHLSGLPLRGSWLLTLSKHLDFKKNNRSSTALFTVRRELCLCLCQQL